MNSKRTVVTTDMMLKDNSYYGAPELIRLYEKYAIRGLVIALAFVILLSGGYLLANKISRDKDLAEQEQNKREITLEDLQAPPPTSEAPPPPEIEIPEKLALKDLEALVPEPVAKEKSEILTTKTQEKLDEVKLPVASTGTDDPNKVTWDGVGKLQEKKVEEKVKEEVKVEKKKEIFQEFEVDKKPSAVNLGAIRSSMHYPEIAKASGIEGKVTAKVLVGTDGSVIKVLGISGPDVFHSEVSDKVMGLQFTPALQNGQPVKCQVSVPFNFTLSSKDKPKKEEDKEKTDGN